MTEEIIKTALLGTDSYSPELGLEFSDIMQKVASQESDKEAAFLKQSAIFFMIQSAAYPLKDIKCDEFAVLSTDNIISEQAQSVLQKALSEDNLQLLDFCFHTIERQNKTISPYLIPDVLEKYESDSRRLKEIVSLCGNIGKAILKMKGLSNPETDHDTRVDDVETLSYYQIKKWVTSIRTTDPKRIWDIEKGESRSYFDEILNREKPEKRSELLELLQIGISKSDEPHLKMQLKSKSKTVKATAIRLLMQIDGTEVQQDFIQLIRELLSFEIQKQFMGIRKSRILSLVSDHQLSSGQKGYGLEEISSQKNISDAMHHLDQCIELMPITLIAETLETDEEEIIERLSSDWKNEYIRQALTKNACNFKNKSLIRHILKTGDNPLLAEYLPFEEALGYFQNWLKKTTSDNHQNRYTIEIFNWLFNEEYKEVNNGFAVQLLNTLKSQSYSIQGKQYYLLGLYLPPECKDWLVKEINQSPGGNENEYFRQQIQLSLQAIEDKQDLIR